MPNLHRNKLFAKEFLENDCNNFRKKLKKGITRMGKGDVLVWTASICIGIAVFVIRRRFMPY